MADAIFEHPRLVAISGLEVTGVDPAAGSLEVARAKPGAERVRWIHADATSLPRLQVDLATMTGNVAQAIVDPSWCSSHAWPKAIEGSQDAERQTADADGS